MNECWRLFECTTRIMLLKLYGFCKMTVIIRPFELVDVGSKFRITN